MILRNEIDNQNMQFALFNEVVHSADCLWIATFSQYIKTNVAFCKSGDIPMQSMLSKKNVEGFLCSTVSMY